MYCTDRHHIGRVSDFLNHALSHSALERCGIYSNFFLLRKDIGCLKLVPIVDSFTLRILIVILSGRVDHRFVPIGKILKPLINECVTLVTCYWSLALLLRDEEELLLVFQVKLALVLISWLIENEFQQSNSKLNHAEISSSCQDVGSSMEML